MFDHYEEYTPNGLSVYEYLLQKSKEYEDHTALYFYGKRFSYKEMMEKIDEIARALVAYGIQKDDVVASSLPGCPEGVFLVYAINKIGAVYCAFDCRSRHSEIRETLDLFSPKLCFIPDFQVNDFADIYDVPTVHVNIVSSLSGFVSVGCFLANLFKGRIRLCARHENMISFPNFVRKAQGDAVPPTCKSSQNLFGYFYTSGTTRGRKSIILTYENINATVIQQRQAYPMVQPGDSFLNFMPLFTCYSVSLALHLPLTAGVTVNVIPLLKAKNLKKTIERERPNVVITVPAHWEWFVKQNFENCDLSFLKAAIVGGDVMGEDFQDRINRIFEKCGCKQPLVIGYGLSETTSTATTTILSAPRGSVGRALKNTLVAIFDEETGRMLGPNEQGEICVAGPTLCLGYYNDPEMTDRLLKTHDDGRVWLHSGDRGYMDQSGAIFFCERIKRMYVRYDGTKISPYSIEQTLLACPAVARCLVVSIRDAEHSHGMCAKVMIVPAQGLKPAAAKEAVERFVCKHLDRHMIPKEIEIVEKLPYTQNGKLDYFPAQPEQ